MSVGYREEELSDTSLAELYASLGSEDTPGLFDSPYELDTSHDWPAAGGMSLDRKTVYIDRTLYQQVMDDEFKACGADRTLLVNAWVRHERVENSIIAGDNPVDTYLPGHNRGLASEHEMYRFAGVSPAKVEKAIWPALVECYKRDPKRPPKDAWCGMFLNEQTERDQELVEILTKLGVYDAAKYGKWEVHYGTSAHRCDRCQHWAPEKLSQEHGQLALCQLVSGIIRDSRGCELWTPRSSKRR